MIARESRRRFLRPRFVPSARSPPRVGLFRPVARTTNDSSDASCHGKSLFRSTRRRGPRFPLHVNEESSSGPKRLPFDEVRRSFQVAFAAWALGRPPPRSGFATAPRLPRSLSPEVFFLSNPRSAARSFFRSKRFPFRRCSFRRFGRGEERARQRLPSIRSASTIRRIDRTPRLRSRDRMPLVCGPAVLSVHVKTEVPTAFRAVPGCFHRVRDRRRFRVRQRSRRFTARFRAYVRSGSSMTTPITMFANTSRRRARDAKSRRCSLYIGAFRWEMESLAPGTSRLELPLGRTDPSALTLRAF